MKTLLLLIIIALSLRAQAQVGVYHPFPDSNAVWNIFSTYSCSTFVFDYNYHSYEIINDTIIHTFNYHKLWTRAEITTGQCGNNCVCPGHYSGAIRQDIPNKKVYFIPVADSVEKLLYDFSLNVGDTLRSYLNNCLGFKVSAIDSILIENNYRKRFFVGNWYIIEGIGSTRGLLETLCTYDGNSNLTCFEQNGTTLYPNSTTTCNVITSINNISEKNISITLSPNPFHTTATLEIKNKELKNAELRIYNVMGRLVQQQTITTPSTLLHRNSLADGIYFYQLVSDNGELASGKFVIE